MALAPTHLPKPATPVAVSAILFAALCVLAAFYASRLIRASIASLEASSFTYEIVFGLVILATAALFWPAAKSFLLTREAAAARARNDAVDTRIFTAAAKDKAALTFGWGTFALLMLGFFAFIFMNDAAVGKTFFRLSLIADRWLDVAWRFVTVNVFVALVAQALVLMWGLVVALARMMPGPAGQPVRFLATLILRRVPWPPGHCHTVPDRLWHPHQRHSGNHHSGCLRIVCRHQHHVSTGAA